MFAPRTAVLSRLSGVTGRVLLHHAQQQQKQSLSSLASLSRLCNRTSSPSFSSPSLLSRSFFGVASSRRQIAGSGVTASALLLSHRPTTTSTPSTSTPNLWRNVQQQKAAFSSKSSRADAPQPGQPPKRKKKKKVVKRKIRVGGVALETAIENLKVASVRNFVESLDISIHLGVDPRRVDEMVRGSCVLPHGTGKPQVVAVFARPGPLAEAARQAGADHVGLDDLLQRIQSGELKVESLTKVLATPDAMGVVGRIGRVLGPRGLMPNAKVGTMTTNIGPAVQEAKQGMLTFKCEKEGIVHAGLGKLNWDTKVLVENVTAFVEAVKASRPSGAKGVFLRGSYLSSSMSRGSWRLDIKLPPFRTVPSLVKTEVEE